jgi:hypothetical protein
MGLLPVEEDITKMLFSSRKTQHACRLFLNVLKERGSLSRRDVHQFSLDLMHGKIEEGFTFSRSHFYREIRHTLIAMGLVSMEARFVDPPRMELSPERKRRREVELRYVPVRQPIPVRPPVGLNLPRLIWVVCQKWNDAMFKRLRNE